VSQLSNQLSEIEMVRGPSQEEYEQFTPWQKIVYWTCVAIMFAVVGGLAIKKFFFS
jgi:thiosulfate reductase cytochrome b subunit